MAIPLAQYHKVVYLSGLGVYEKESKQHAKTVSSYVYDHSARVPSKVSNIVNTSTLLHNDNAKIKTLQSYITDYACIDSGDEASVQLVIFAHSLGVKTVYEATSKESLIEIVKNKVLIPGTDVEWEAQKVRQHVAIITMGGVGAIPQDRAQIVKNYRYSRDLKSTLGSWLFGCNTWAEWRSMRVINPGHPDEDTGQGLWWWLTRFPLYALRSVFSPSSYHVAEQYFRSDEIQEQLQKFRPP